MAANSVISASAGVMNAVTVPPAANSPQKIGLLDLAMTHTPKISTISETTAQTA